MVAIAASTNVSSRWEAPQPVAPVRGRFAAELALGYLRYASACWRGDNNAPFARLMDACWRPELPPAPAAAPDAVSPHGGGGRGIAWYEACGEVRGYVPGKRGGYRVPLRAIPRLLASVPACPAETQERTTAQVENTEAPQQARPALVFLTSPWSRRRRRHTRRHDHDFGDPKFRTLPNQEAISR